MAKFKAEKSFTYKGKDYFKGDSIEVADVDVAGLKQYGRISEGAVKEASENKAKGLKKAVKKYLKINIMANCQAFLYRS